MVIAAIPSVSMCWLIPRMARFREKHPEIETRIVYAIHGYDIDFTTVHLAFTFLPERPQGPDIEAAYFLCGDSLPVCSPALLSRYAVSARDPLDLRSLGLLHDEDTTGWRRWFDPDGSRDIGPLNGPSFEDFNLLRAAALSAQGVALCPLTMVQPDLETGALVRLSDRYVGNGSDYYLVKSKRVSAATQKRIDIFSEWAMSERVYRDDWSEII